MDKKLIAGVDEVGRGPLAGPVVAAAVILDSDSPIHGLADSKKLSEKARQTLTEIIKREALAWSIGCASVAEIDSINILQASFLAMQRAVLQLQLEPQHVLVDGNQCPKFNCSADAIIKGDEQIAAIQAASIIAKVTRDNMMVTLDSQYPGYGFAAHKGYPTKQHRQALQELGVTKIHRRSYRPVKKALICHS